MKSFKREPTQKTLIAVKTFMDANIRKQLAQIRQQRSGNSPQKLKKQKEKEKLRRRLTLCGDPGDVIELTEDEMVDNDEDSMMDIDPTCGVSTTSRPDADSDDDQALIINESAADDVSNEPTSSKEEISLQEKIKDPSLQPKLILEKIDELPKKGALLSPALAVAGEPAATPPAPPPAPSAPPAETNPPSEASTTSKDDSSGPPTPTTPQKATPKKRKKPKPEKHTFAFPITEFMNAKYRRENALVFSSLPQEMRNFVYEVDPDKVELIVSHGKETPIDKELQDVQFKHLLAWPDISFSLNLPELEITRQCVSNVRRELIKADAIETPPETNGEELKRYYHNQTLHLIAQAPDKEIELSVEMIVVYLELVLKVVQETKQNRQAGVGLLIEMLIHDLQRLKRCFLGIGYSYFLNRHPYQRTFKPPADFHSKKHSNEQLLFKEIFNPEIVFKITRCTFEERNNTFQPAPLESYFLDLLEMKNPQAIEKFHSVLNKSITVGCTNCTFKHLGTAIMLLIIKNHIKRFSKVPFKCAACEFQADQLELADRLWQHSCTIAAPPTTNGSEVVAAAAVAAATATEQNSSPMQVENEP